MIRTTYFQTFWSCRDLVRIWVLFLGGGYGCYVCRRKILKVTDCQNISFWQRQYSTITKPLSLSHFPLCRLLENGSYVFVVVSWYQVTEMSSIEYGCKEGIIFILGFNISLWFSLFHSLAGCRWSQILMPKKWQSHPMGKLWVPEWQGEWSCNSSDSYGLQWTSRQARRKYLLCILEVYMLTTTNKERRRSICFMGVTLARFKSVSKHFPIFDIKCRLC